MQSLREAPEGASRVCGVASRKRYGMTTTPASHQDLLDAQFATPGTVDDGGYPQLTVVWFLHEDGELKVSLDTARAKARYLRERPQCSLLILDTESPYRFVELRGRAEIEDDPEYAFAQRLGQKYGGADVREYDPPGSARVIVTVRPETVYPVDLSG